MRSLLLGGAAALAFTVAASAQSANDATTAAPASGAGPFITKQDVGIVRAPKLVGVAVYDKDNKSIGKVADLLLDKQGKVEAVVIGIGGFLGIGTKDVALPYDQVHWQTEQRTVATGSGTGAGGAGGGVTGTTAANNANTTQPSAAQPAQKTVSAEQQEAYNGYPDRAVVDMSQQQLKDAPEFKYASQTMNSDGTPAGSAQKP
jgi:sporulation protein YlmC with PRC-barrel domain